MIPNPRRSINTTRKMVIIWRLLDFIESALYGMIASMSLQRIYAWSKKIHNWAMWIMILLGVPVALTGIILENEILSVWAAGMDWGYKVRELHGSLSGKFALVLAIMMVTGLLMWAIPRILSKRAQSKLS